jgi:hypothetical protein
MEGTRQSEQRPSPERHFREQGDESTDGSVKATLNADLPLEVNTTDEPGGDPYNHTGSFERLYR